MRGGVWADNQVIYNDVLQVVFPVLALPVEDIKFHETAEFARAHGDDLLRCTLHYQSDDLWVVLQRVGHCHSLAL